MFRNYLTNRESGDKMFTISDILQDIDRGITANNMVEDKFSYRIIFFVNEGNKSSKRYIDTMYGDLRKTLESIIKGHLSLINRVVVADTTVRKDGKSVCLQSRSYAFSLDEYFRQLSGESKGNSKRGNSMYNRYAVN